VYEPLGSFPVGRKGNSKLDFKMRLEKPTTQEGGTRRYLFINFTAYDPATHKRVSAVRLSDYCGNGDCVFSTTDGQFNDAERFKPDLKVGFSFRPIALSSASERISLTPDAPQIIIFQDTARKLKPLFDDSEFGSPDGNAAFAESVKDIIKYYDDTLRAPDFSGFDVWKKTSCAQ